MLRVWRRYSEKFCCCFVKVSGFDGEDELGDCGVVELSAAGVAFGGLEEETVGGLSTSDICVVEQRFLRWGCEGHEEEDWEEQRRCVFAKKLREVNEEARKAGLIVKNKSLS